MEARTATSIPAGQNLKLEVIRLGNLPILRLLNGTTTAPDLTTLAVRTALPRQMELGPLLANLVLLARIPQSGLKPCRITSLATALFQQLPRKETLTAGENALRRTLLNSGLFLEARLARQAGSGIREGMGTDLKAGLLRLLAALQGDRQETAGAPRSSRRDFATNRILPPLRGAFPQPQAANQPTLMDRASAEQLRAELQHQVEGALARIQLSQFASLAAEEEGRAVWLLELPVRRDDDCDLIGLRIEQDGEEKDERHEPWAVSLAFNLPGLGPVRARISMSGKQISAAFWAEREETNLLFRESLSVLHAQLEGAGLEVGTLACHIGRPAETTLGGDVPRLLDERA